MYKDRHLIPLVVEIVSASSATRLQRLSACSV
jgi:hypothetical protein